MNFGLTKKILLEASTDTTEHKTLVSATILAVLVASDAIYASSPKHVPASSPAT